MDQSLIAMLCVTGFGLFCGGYFVGLVERDSRRIVDDSDRFTKREIEKIRRFMT